MLLSSVILAAMVVVASAMVHRNQNFAKIMHTEWNLATDKAPPVQETTDMTEKTNGNRKTITFKAMGLHWRLDVEENKVLFAKNFQFLYTDQRGNVRQSYGPMKNCFFVGTADAGSNENGLAAVTSCQGTFRAYIITNINDYMINTPVPTYSYIKEMVKGDYTGPTSNHTSAYSSGKEIMEIVPHRKPIDGRVAYQETALYFDQGFQTKFRNVLQLHQPADMRIYAIELMNFAQLWHLHHTLGYRLWFVVRSVVLLTESYPANKRMTGVCYWHIETFPQHKDLDGTFIFSSDNQVCYGMGGAAIRNSACSPDLHYRCTCVHDNNFHPSVLIRTFAHEAAHPLGIHDDYKPPMSNYCYYGIMKGGVYEDKDWSACSSHSLDRFYSIADNTCLWRTNTKSLEGSTYPNNNIPINVAWRASAVQSSTYVKDELWGAWKATDGPIAGLHSEQSNPLFASCTHTQKEDKPWIRIDLGNDYSGDYIQSIDIFNREDCCENRLANFEVRVGDYEQIAFNKLCFHHKGGVPGGKYGMVRILCTSSMKGRYVSVQLLDTDKILTVCQINVNQNVWPKDLESTKSGCTDKAWNCDDRIGTCNSHPEMKTDCRFTCGFCEKPNTPKLNRALTSLEQPSTARPECKDTGRLCSHYKSNNQCKGRVYQCTRSCDPLCQDGVKIDPNCQDDKRACSSWASNGHCSSPHIRKMCKRSCGDC